MDELGSESVWQWDGCPRDYQPDASPRCAASPTARAGIRCCGDAAGCVSVCFGHCWMKGSNTSAPHAGWRIDGAAVTLAEAKSECQARNMRLCTRSELGRCCYTGCRLDNAHVWTADVCEPTNGSSAAEKALPASVACNRQLLHRFNSSALASSKAPSPPPAPCSARWCGVGPRMQPLLAAARPLRCGVLWFLHIGKTGGSTVANFLKASQDTAGWQFVEFWGKAANPHWNQSSGWRRIQQALGASAAPRLAVHHHHGVPGVLAPELGAWLAQLRLRLKARGCALIVATLLREPVSRALSHGTYDRATPPELCGHARDTSDTQWRSLLATWGCDQARVGPCVAFGRGDDPAPSLPQRLALATRALGGGSTRAAELGGSWLRRLAEVFDLVGATHELARFLALLRGLIGYAGVVAATKAVVNPTDDCDKYEPSPEQLWWVREHNQVDAALYSAWCSESCEQPRHASFSGWREIHRS